MMSNTNTIRDEHYQQLDGEIVVCSVCHRRSFDSATTAATTRTSDAAAAAATDENTKTAAATVMFSNRQRKRAMAGQSARCMECTAGAAAAAAAHHQPQQHQHQQDDHNKKEPAAMMAHEGTNDATTEAATVAVAETYAAAVVGTTTCIKETAAAAAAATAAADSSNDKQPKTHPSHNNNNNNKMPSMNQHIRFDADGKPCSVEDIPIPRKSNRNKTKNKKKKKNTQQQSTRSIHTENENGNENDDDDDDSHSDNHFNDENDNDDDTNYAVSLNALKEQILGRKWMDSSSNSSSNNNNSDEDQPQQQKEKEAIAIRYNLKNNHKHNNNSIPDALRRELTCAICHETLYQPVSLPCGHSFCRECVTWWWFTMQQQQQQQQSLLLSFDAAATITNQNNNNNNMKNCPTCRRPYKLQYYNSNNISNNNSSQDDEFAFGINTALRACIEALLGDEVEERKQAAAAAQKQATKGEHDGAHTRGYEVLSSVDEQEWETIRAATKKLSAIQARRSIVLDEQDQRMQLALAICCESSDDSPPLHYSTNNLLQVTIGLLHMEEDEVTDPGSGGFPLVVNQEGDCDDEALLAKHDDRFISPIHVTAILTNEQGIVTNASLPVTRRLLGQDGTVTFYIDNIDPSASCLCFCHEETGAELQINLPFQKHDGTQSTVAHRPESETTAHRYSNHSLLEEQYENEDYDSALDEFEDDGFLVRDDHDEESHNGDDDDDDDDEGVCCLCNDGGELIVCDGGDKLAGCGCFFHLACINRDVIPPGDWVCKGCANSFGLQHVGIEGHEFVDTPIEQNNESKKDQDTPRRRLKRIRNDSPKSDDGSSDEEEFTGKFSPEVNSSGNDGDSGNDSDKAPQRAAHLHDLPSKRRRVIDDDDDDDRTDS